MLVIIMLVIMRMVATPLPLQIPSQPAPDRQRPDARSSVPVFALSLVRGNNIDLSQPVNRIDLSPGFKSMLLSLELGSDFDLQSYRATIFTLEGRKIWSRSGLEPASKNALTLRFNTSLFRQGNYLLTLEGITRQDDHVLAAKYFFRIITAS
jgi:hypothetical protein